MKITKTPWKYIFWLGPLLIAAGSTAAIASSAWEPLTIGLVIAGTVTIGLWILCLAYEQGFWGRRSTQASANALISTIAVLVILGLINFIAVRYSTRIDLTESKQFTLAPQTQQILQNLQQPVSVWVFDPAKNPEIKELLESYKRLGGKNFNFEFVDPLAQPGKAREFNITSIGEIYLQAGNKKQLLQKGGTAFGSDPDRGLSEIKLTNGLEELLSTRTPVVYFVQGRGEREIQEGQGAIGQAEKVLKDKYYTVQVLNLAETKEVPENADALVVAGPTKPFADAEIKALQAYLDRGGSLFLMVDPATNTGLDKFLQEWGVKLDTRLAIDASGTGQRFGLGPTVPTVRRYGPHPITQSFGTGISFFPFARPVETSEVAGIEQTPLIWTSEESWAESDLTNRKLEFDPKTDRQGPLVLGVALVRSGAAVAPSTLPPSPSTPSPSPTLSPAQPSPQASPTEESPLPSPTTSPTASPTSPSPTTSPTVSPTSPSPTTSPASPSPTTSPTSPSPTESPTTSPTSPSPTTSPASPSPTVSPTSPSPTTSPTTSPTVSPTSPSPTTSPTTPSPTTSPTTPSPTESPTASPISYSVIVSQEATPPAVPTASPTASPTNSESPTPTTSPTASPSPTSTIPAPLNAQKISRMVVIGTSQFAANGWFDQQLNSDVFLNSVSWLSKPDQQSFSISPKKSTNRRINMTVVQVGLLVLGWLIWPLLGLLIGGTLWWKRR